LCNKIQGNPTYMITIYQPYNGHCLLPEYDVRRSVRQTDGHHTLAMPPHALACCSENHD